MPEPVGGAHRGRADALSAVGDALERHLSSLEALDADALRADRAERFRRMGRFVEARPERRS